MILCRMLFCPRKRFLFLMAENASVENDENLDRRTISGSLQSDSYHAKKNNVISKVRTSTTSYFTKFLSLSIVHRPMINLCPLNNKLINLSYSHRSILLINTEMFNKICLTQCALGIFIFHFLSSLLSRTWSLHNFTGISL